MTCPEHELQPTTVTGRVKALLNDLALARELRAGYNDQAAIERDLERIVAAEKIAAQGVWAEMRADGVPVAEAAPEAEPEHEASTPEADAGEPESEPESEPEAAL